MSRRSIAAVAAIVIVVVLIVSMASICSGLSDVGMSAAGWFVLVLGVLAILALGIGLTAFVFISNHFGDGEIGMSPPQPNAATQKKPPGLRRAGP